MQENIDLAPGVFEGWMVLHTWDESFEALIPGLSGIETYRLPWYSTRFSANHASHNSARVTYYPADNCYKINSVIQWIMIYTVDSVTHPLLEELGPGSLSAK